MLFVTGTGTEVGKTHFSLALLTAWRMDGRSPLAIKPFETGCEPDPQDAIALANGCGRPALANWDLLYRARRPVAPWAATLHGEPAPNLEQIDQAVGLLSDIQRQGQTPSRATPSDRRALKIDPFGDPESGLFKSAQVQVGTTPTRPRDLDRDVDVPVLVEGAGGPLVPLEAEITIADWAAGRFSSVVLVAANQLGVLSHTFTAVECMLGRGLPLKAVVLNATETSDVSQEKNLEMLQQRLDVPVFDLRRGPPAALAETLDPQLVSLR